MLRLELKKMLTTPANLIIIAFALLFSPILSYIPVTYESCFVFENGQPVRLKGKAALTYMRETYAAVEGQVTPELIKKAVSEYNAVLEEYQVSSADDLPEGVYSFRIGPYYHILHMLREAYADSKTGVFKDLNELSESDLDQFEQRRAERIVTLWNRKTDRLQFKGKQPACTGRLLFRFPIILISAQMRWTMKYWCSLL